MRQYVLFYPTFRLLSNFYQRIFLYPTPFWAQKIPRKPDDFHSFRGKTRVLCYRVLSSRPPALPPLAYSVLRLT